MSRELRDKIADLALKMQEEEIEKLTAQVKQLESLVNYWRIEAQCSEGRWIHALEDLDKIRNEIRNNGNDTKSGN